MNKTNKMVCAPIATLTLIGLLVGGANAALVITVTQEGDDVLISGQGIVNTAGLVAAQDTWGVTPPSGGNGSIQPSGGHIANRYFIPNLSTYTYYTGMSSTPNNFGNGSYAEGLWVGDPLRIGGSGRLILPQSYSGEVLSFSLTFIETDIASLGMTSGEHVWSWGSGQTADSITLSVESVPEPSSAILLGLGGLSLLARRKRI